MLQASGWACHKAVNFNSGADRNTQSKSKKKYFCVLLYANSNYKNIK